MVFMGLTPAILAIHEVSKAVGIPKSGETPLMLFAVIWIVLLVWKFKDWDEHRWFKNTSPL
ncbi:MAG: hypothetical protein UY76_C0003G0020, partial [Candidatus Uhrbacteria bacterium GW2011_GWA2_52_8d]